MQRFLPALFFLFLAVPLAAQDLRTPAIFGDHMVLQRGNSAPVWGWAAPGAKVEARGSWGSAGTATADAAGRWRIDLATKAGPGTFELAVRSGAAELRFTDVLLGEVWLCGGQSNMEWTVGPAGIAGNGVNDWQAEVAAAKYPGIRYFDVAHAVSIDEQEDCQGQWKVCSPDTISAFSAAGYFFGRALHRELEVPVGLVGCNWGGTLAEAWTSAEGLDAVPDFGPFVAGVRKARANPDGAGASLAERQRQWWLGVAKTDPGEAGGWHTAAYDHSKWAVAALPATWEGPLGSFDGAVWYRKAFGAPASWVGRDLVLELGPIDDFDTTWVNGVLVGSHHGDNQWQAPRKYTIPSALVREGGNLISVRALDGSGAGGVNGQPEQLRVYPADAPQAAVPLAGEWRERRGVSMGQLGAFPRGNWFHNNAPTALFNGMLAPVIPYGIRGAIFYQGESNRTRHSQYRALFPAMIRDWRGHWGRGDFPFYYVQIAPYRYGGDTGEAAALREAQTLAMDVEPNTGMVVTMDIGNPGNIHPLDKQEVGRRLALWALARAYGFENLECSGPLYRAMRVAGSAVTLEFTYADNGLEARGGPLRHFTIAGADRVFHPAEARIEGNAVVVSSAAVAVPVAVRFGWGDADETNLYNTEGLPSPSFRTDTWTLP
ncbi:MAG TPA: sialate O-acetylesterase [Planctomycetota bacterium]